VFLVVCVILSGVPCVAIAQDADPDPPSSPQVSDVGSIFAPSVWMLVSIPVQKTIDLKIYGFYIGELDVPCAQVDIPIRAAKFLTVTPSYLYYSVPPSGLSKLSPGPSYTENYSEHQYRIDANVLFPIRKLEMSIRNMYVRRFREPPFDDANRYRGRIAVAHPVPIYGRNWRPFVSVEAYYEHNNGGWNRDRVWTGVTVPLTGSVLFQPSYLWENSKGGTDINYLLFGLIVNI
jgi:Protein of unknown function (DUF2490)